MAVPTSICRQCARLAARAARQNVPRRPFSSSSALAEAQRYPLYPSVQHLLHENNISDADAAKIPASGPNGRLLKGDVLAFLGQIDKSYPMEQSKRLDKLGHLDLSNIKVKEPQKPAEAAPAAAAEAEIPAETEIAVPISLAAVLACQKRIQDTLGINLPLSTFIARAVEMANEDLPPGAKKPTADDLFHSVLGLDKVHGRTSRGNFMPSVVALPAVDAGLHITPTKQPDIIDLLGPKPKKPTTIGRIPASLRGTAAENVFSVTAGKEDEQRAAVFLERMKSILELQPGRLVL